MLEHSPTRFTVYNLIHLCNSRQYSLLLIFKTETEKCLKKILVGSLSVHVLAIMVLL